MGEYIKDYDSWNKYKKTLNENGFGDYCHEREVWWCAIGVNIGSEQDGKNERFERPVLIIRKIRKDLLLVAPLTSKISDEPQRIYTESTGEKSQILLDQTRTISNKRLLGKIGRVKKAVYQEVLIGIIQFLLINTKTPL